MRKLLLFEVYEVFQECDVKTQKQYGSQEILAPKNCKKHKMKNAIINP
jgi:hypothetical protein